MAMSLQHLLAGWIEIPPALDRTVLQLTSDSRNVQTSAVFVALADDQDLLHAHIKQAIEKGATAVLLTASAINNSISMQHTIPLIPIANLDQTLGYIAARFYGNPSHNLFMIGITGTNGKTSCSHFIAQCLTRANINCGIIGTLGNGFYGALETSPFTTPYPIELQGRLNHMQEQGAVAVAMEVSSHALELGRVVGVEFDLALFTNLTRDHLDFHKTMEQYAQAKQRLFAWEGLRYAVLNYDDPFSETLLQQISPNVEVFGYTLNPALHLGKKNTVIATQIELHAMGSTTAVTTPWGQGILTTNLLGRFNISNLLAVLTTLCLRDVPLSRALELLSEVETVKGRLQTLQASHQPLVVVDYSHTPDALQKGLEELRAHHRGEIWCVFGCGGDRDRGKRPVMGDVAERYADHIIITDDNPRSEDPKVIVAEILQGIKNSKNCVIEHDRAKAIDYAIAHAKPNDVVLVAGKGHEDYQIIGTEKRFFSDVDYVKTVFKLGDKQ